MVLLLTSPVAFVAWVWHTARLVDLSDLHNVPIVYAAGQRLSAGLPIEAIDLAGTLRRLGYEEVASRPRRPGGFLREEDAWQIFLRPRDDPRARRPAIQVRVPLQGSRITAVINSSDGSNLEGIEIDPEVLSGRSDAPGRVHRPVPLSTVPRHLIAAVLAAEDHRFFEHRGIDGIAVLRAIWMNLRRGEIAQGGSTLTQQLVKTLLLSPRRTWDRKLREAALALMLEWRYRKEEILEAYLNGIYLGHHRGAAVYGVGAAAHSYFGRDVAQVSVSQGALLAGMIRSPNSVSPSQNLDGARERRNTVLHRMRELDFIDTGTFTTAIRERVRVVQRERPARLGSHFIDYVLAQANGRLNGDLAIYTTLDPSLQRAAEAALIRGLDRLEGQFGHLRRSKSPDRLQGAILAVDPANGEILAMVGGRDYASSQFNRATHARRQPGSAFKPFVYLAALRRGRVGEPPQFTPTSLVEDRPISLLSDRAFWSPRNYEGRFEGTVTVRRALEQSLNAATVHLAQSVGLTAILRTARDVGFTSRMKSVPALALGSFEVTPLELAGAYATLANAGKPVRPTWVPPPPLDNKSSLVQIPTASRTTGISTEEAFLVTYLLRGVVGRGTGAAVRTLGVGGAVAGKTGTTNEGRDGWFVGYTPRLVALVWVGFDQRDALGLSGAEAALPIWADFMRTAMAVRPSGPFTAPASVVFRDVDPTNGKLATPFCPLVYREAFLPFTEPREVCRDHTRPANFLFHLLGSSRRWDTGEESSPGEVPR